MSVGIEHLHASPQYALPLPALGATGVSDALARRALLDVPTYEALLRDGETGGAPPADFTGDFAFCGVREERRRYAAVREVLAA